MKIEFIGQSAQSPSNIGADPQRLFNFFRRVLSDGRHEVKAVPGTVEVTQLTGAMCRAMATVSGQVYVVHGGSLWSISQAGTATELASVPDSEETTISGNNGKVTVCADGRYFVWDGSSLTEPAAGAFSAFGAVTFHSQRTILTEQGGRRVQWSNVADPSTLGGLSFATAESRDDEIIRAMALGPEIWVFKETSIERWYPTESGFSILPGSTIDKGLKAFRLVTKLDTGAFFVANDGKVYLCAAGGAMQKISFPALETIIAGETPQSAMYYRFQGAEMCVLTFINRPAWCFDLISGEWHERGTGKFNPWTMRHSAQAYGNDYVCNDVGEFCRLDDVTADHDGPLIRVAVSRNFDNQGFRFRLARFVLAARTGFTGDVMLRLSKDRGVTWTAPKVRSLGATGRYETQAVWRALGGFRNCALEVSISDDVDASFESVGVVDMA